MTDSFPKFLRLILVITAIADLLVLCALGQDSPNVTLTARSIETSRAEFGQRVQPLLKQYCFRCHCPENMKSGVRVDDLTGSPEDRQLPLLKGMHRQIEDGNMPPEEEPQPSVEDRAVLVSWIKKTIDVARSRPSPRNGSVRRLTVLQYKNTLRDLLGIQQNVAESLPPDGVSKDGFTNNVQTLSLNPLQVDSYFEIAEKALEYSIVDADAMPVIQNFRMEFGTSINPAPCPDSLILGANSELLKNADFLVTEPDPEKSFAFQPMKMRTAYDFIEGYAGNDTVRGWRKYDIIYHSVFACVRGTPGYPKGLACEVIQGGLLLRPAIPSPEIFGQSDTYGPMANFKISLRELPEHGNFRVKVKAACYHDGLLLDAGWMPKTTTDTDGALSLDISPTESMTLKVDREGIYQLDLLCFPGKPQGIISLALGDRDFSGSLFETASKSEPPESPIEVPTAFMLVRLPAQEIPVKVRYGDNSRLRKIVFSRIDDSSEVAARFKKFEQRSLSLGVHLGLRRDCGSTLTRVGDPQIVSNREFDDFTFEGAIENFPNPDVENDNVNYLAGIREIGVRSEYTDGRDMPRLVIRSIEFEGPYFTSWPPESHQRIFVDSPNRNDPSIYAREIIRLFASRAFRRPVDRLEEDAVFKVWENSFSENGDFRQSIKDALLVVLTSPQFLFLIENSRTPEPEDLDAYELASKLSYLFWNTSPDDRLLSLATANQLHQSLDSEIDRMITDPRFEQFIREFSSQWLSLDMVGIVSVDLTRFPRLTPYTRKELQQEPIQFLRFLIEKNLPIKNLVQSDFVVANEVVASYYQMGDQIESGFRFIPITHTSDNLGGVLTQAGILAGLSDGRESNPIKRGAWIARKIVAEPPEDPPPNVPRLNTEDASTLALRERLERHRNQKGCVKCHSGIDPWGIPFEAFDAGGLPKKSSSSDTQSTLPDGTQVADVNSLKTYLANDRIDQVAFSFMKHFASYASGRSLSYNEIAFLQDHGIKLKDGDYRMRDLIRFVVHSDLFLKK